VRPGVDGVDIMLTTPRRDSMRRIALAAALATTLAGGAAALAATPGPAGTDAAPPDPYQGAWQLMLDGSLAGPVLNVDGCDLAAPVVVSPGNHKHDGAVAPEPCTFDIGAGMSHNFSAWLNDSLQGGGATHDVQLVRSDVRPGYALDLPHATVAAVTLPKIDRAAVAPVYLHVALASDQVRRIAATGIQLTARERPILPSTLAVSVAGQPVPGATSVGPWTGAIKLGANVGIAREAAPTVDVGDLPIRVAATTAKSADVAGWAQGVMLNGRMDERPVTVSVGGMTLTLGGAAPHRADLVPRADGALTYDLYAETAGLTGPH
jgi:hypothetical protein